MVDYSSNPKHSGLKQALVVRSTAVAKVFTSKASDTLHGNLPDCSGIFKLNLADLKNTLPRVFWPSRMAGIDD